MAAFPFLREAIARMASRLEVDVPLIGLLKTGQFQLHAEKPADTSATQVTAPPTQKRS